MPEREVDTQRGIMNQLDNGWIARNRASDKTNYVAENGDRDSVYLESGARTRIGLFSLRAFTVEGLF